MDIFKISAMLDKEFEVEETKEDWQALFDPLFAKKAYSKFKTPLHNTGLMIVNSQEVNKIYTAFSPSRYVLEEIRMKGVVNCLLVVKHPFDWDGRRNGPGFIHFKDRDYQLMESMGISVYSLHSPIDKSKNGKVLSTSEAFAKIIKLRIEEEFALDPHNPSSPIGLIGTVSERRIDALVKRLSSTLNYKVKLKKDTEEVGKVALVTGQGFIPEFVQEARDLGAKTYITGVTTYNSSEHDKKNYSKNLSAINKSGLNILGCSHYLTEKWVMELSIPYFSCISKAEFIEDKEALNLLE